MSPLPSPVYFSMSQSLIPWVQLKGWLLVLVSPEQNYFFPTLTVCSAQYVLMRCWPGGRDQGLQHGRHCRDTNPLKAWPRVLRVRSHLILLRPSWHALRQKLGEQKSFAGADRLHQQEAQDRTWDPPAAEPTSNAVVHRAPNMGYTVNWIEVLKISLPRQAPGLSGSRMQSVHPRTSWPGLSRND